MQRIFKRFTRVLLAFVVLWGASELWTIIDADAQQRTRRRTTNRAKLWLSMRNNGTLGHSLDGGSTFGVEVGMSYPGRWTSNLSGGHCEPRQSARQFARQWRVGDGAHR